MTQDFTNPGGSIATIFQNARSLLVFDIGCNFSKCGLIGVGFAQSEKSLGDDFGLTALKFCLFVWDSLEFEGAVHDLVFPALRVAQVHIAARDLRAQAKVIQGRISRNLNMPLILPGNRLSYQVDIRGQLLLQKLAVDGIIVNADYEGTNDSALAQRG